MLSACGHGQRQDDVYAQYLQDIPSDEAHNDSVLVLSVLLPEHAIPPGRSDPFPIAERAMNRKLAESGQTLRVELSTFSHNERHDIATRMTAMMMAGNPYDLFHFMLRGHSIWHDSQSGFLACIYTLMDESPNTSREDFFTNVLDAFTVDDGLYAFPLNFGFHYITINSSLPQELVYRFTEKETVCKARLMYLYLELQRMYNADFGHLYVAEPLLYFAPNSLLDRTISNFIDFNSRKANLNNNKFIDFFHNILHIQEFDGFAEIDLVHLTTFPDTQRRIQNAGRYMFMSDGFHSLPLYFLFEKESPYFTQHLPLANSEGELISHLRFGVSPIFSIAAGGQPELAWEFLQHLISPMVVTTRLPPQSSANFNIPIKRAYFQSNFSAVFHHLDDLISEYIKDMNNEAVRSRAIEKAIDRLATLSELPIAAIPLVPIDIIEDDFNQVLRRITTPEDAAQRMDNRITLWLIE